MKLHNPLTPKTLLRLTAGAVSAAAVAALDAGFAHADEKTKPYSIYAQGKGVCVLTHDVSLETKKSRPGHATLIVQPHVGLASGNAETECESVLRVRWTGSPREDARFVVKSPNVAGNKPQTFDLHTGSGTRLIRVGDDSGSPIALGAAEANVQVP